MLLCIGPSILAKAQEGFKGQYDVTRRTFSLMLCIKCGVSTRDV